MARPWTLPPLPDWLQQREDEKAREAAEELEPGVRLRDVICPQCKKAFRLTWNDYSTNRPTTLCIRSCPSGGIYDVSIACPHCDYEEEL